MTYPKLSKKDHALRRKLIKKLGPKAAFDHVVNLARDRERAGKR